MLRYARRSLQHYSSNKSSAQANRVRSPYDILGVTASTPFEEVKKKYRELARQHHPDMPSGNQHTFREVTAAYQIIRTAAKSGKPIGDAESPSSSSSKGFGGARDVHGHRAAEEELKRQGMKKQPSYNRNQWFVAQYLWDSDGWEFLCTLLSACVLAVWTADSVFFSRSPSGYRVDNLDNLSRSKQVPKEAFQPSPTEPLDALLDATRDGVQGASASAEQQGFAKKNSLLERLQKGRMQRFSDAKEFFYENDLDHGDERRVTVARFSADRLDEASVPLQCVHHRAIHSDILSRSYDNKLVETLAADITATRWKDTDARHAGVLAAYALMQVPALSPMQSKWTFVEYKDMDTDSGSAANRQRGHVGLTQCLFAIRNEKFDGKPLSSSLVQRLVVTGSSEGVPSEAVDGGSSKEVVVGGVVRIRDPSFEKRAWGDK